VVASDYGGGATIRMKAAELGLELTDAAIPVTVDLIKDREAEGYAFDVAEASLELLMRRANGWTQPFFEIESYRVHVEERMIDDEPPLAEATVKVRTKGTRHIESAEGAGPVAALDDALRKALVNDYPELTHIGLEDFRVRVLGETQLSRGCRCDPEYITQVIAKFPPEDRAQMADEHGIITVDCAFCATKFPVALSDFITPPL